MLQNIKRTSKENASNSLSLGRLGFHLFLYQRQKPARINELARKVRKGDELYLFIFVDVVNLATIQVDLDFIPGFDPLGSFA
jgi:hypothetical protein